VYRCACRSKVTYLDGHVSARYADDPAYNDDFRNAIVAFGTHLKVTPTTPGCDGIGAVFVMVFPIPDGRVRLVPVKPPQPAPTGGKPNIRDTSRHFGRCRSAASLQGPI
jgi:hypothetical protein